MVEKRISTFTMGGTANNLLGPELRLGKFAPNSSLQITSTQSLLFQSAPRD